MKFSPKITFGVELEFLAQANNDRYDRYHYNNQQDLTRSALSRDLQQGTGLPIAAICPHSICKQCLVCEDAPPSLRGPNFRVFGAKLSHSSNTDPLYQYYLVKHDASLDPVLRASCGMELTTPIRNATEVSKGLPEISAILSTLRNTPLSIGANRTCGMHIHVGLQSGMRLGVAQKLVQLVMMLEKTFIFPLCGESRKRNIYVKPMMVASQYIAEPIPSEEVVAAADTAAHLVRAHFPLSRAEVKSAPWNNHKPASFYVMLLRLWQTDNLFDVAQLLTSTTYGRTGLYLCLREPEGIDCGAGPSWTGNLGEYEGTPSTFEFRYPQTSFDINFVRCWAELTTRLLTIATLDTGSYMRIVCGIIRALDMIGSPGDMRENVLQALGLTHQIQFWRWQMGRYAHNAEVSFLNADGMLEPEV